MRPEHPFNAAAHRPAGPEVVVTATPQWEPARADLFVDYSLFIVRAEPTAGRINQHAIERNANSSARRRVNTGIDLRERTPVRRTGLPRLSLHPEITCIAF